MYDAAWIKQPEVLSRPGTQAIGYFCCYFNWSWWRTGKSAGNLVDLDIVWILAVRILAMTTMRLAVEVNAPKRIARRADHFRSTSGQKVQGDSHAVDAMPCCWPRPLLLLAFKLLSPAIPPKPLMSFWASAEFRVDLLSCCINPVLVWFHAEKTIKCQSLSTSKVPEL